MTFRVYFYAEQAFLSFVKKSICSQCESQNDDIELGAVCVFACAAALEATVNSLLKNDKRIIHFDELRLASKIDTIASLNGEEIDWGIYPWQTIGKLIKVRNWLAHYKNSDIGLVNSDGAWINDDCNKVPKIDPDKELSKESIIEYYDATRYGLIQLFQYLNSEESLYDFLKSENYQSILVG